MSELSQGITLEISLLFFTLSILQTVQHPTQESIRLGLKITICYNFSMFVSCWKCLDSEVVLHKLRYTTKRICDQ